MSGLTERLWGFINGIISIAGFAITSLLIVGSIFSSGIRSNVTDLYYTLISSGIIGLYVFITLTCTLFIAVMNVFFAILILFELTYSNLAKLLLNLILS